MAPRHYQQHIRFRCYDGADLWLLFFIQFASVFSFSARADKGVAKGSAFLSDDIWEFSFLLVLARLCIFSEPSVPEYILKVTVQSKSSRKWNCFPHLFTFFDMCKSERFQKIRSEIYGFLGASMNTSTYVECTLDAISPSPMLLYFGVLLFPRTNSPHLTCCIASLIGEIV